MRSRAKAFTLVEMMIVVAILVVLVALIVPAVDRQTDDAHETVQQVSISALRDACKSMVSDVKFSTGFNYASLRMCDLLSRTANTSALRATAFPEFDPNTRIGWRGPYVTGGFPIRNTRANRANLFPAAADKRTDGPPADRTFQQRGFYAVPYGSDGEPAIGDDWGNPILLQIPTQSSDPRINTPEKCWQYARLVSAGPDGVVTIDPNDPNAGMTETSPGVFSVANRGDDLILFLNRTDVYEP
jgi:prepilin-type N-terminal cleavage/methylation domain-containing protein